MKNGTRIAAALATCLSIGCAGVATQRARDVSSAGLAYTTASQALMDAAMASVVDADSFNKIATKARPGARRPAELKQELAASDKTLVASLTLYQEVRTAMVTLGAYFAALQELADHPQGEATASAVETLANRIGQLDKTLATNPKLVLSEEQTQALGGLARLVSDQVHGALVAAALKRDAETVGTALAISRKAVRIAELDVGRYLGLKQDAFFREKVEKPFVAQSMDDQWIEDRRLYLKASALGNASAEIAKAEAASEQMEATWKKVLSGELSATELHVLVGEIHQLLQAAETIRAATEPATAPAAP